MAFGINNPTTCAITLNEKEIPCVSKVRYLGLYVLCNSCMLDITEASPKFYGSFNNTMSVLGKHSIEMTAVCCLLLSRIDLPSLTSGCEMWMVVKCGILARVPPPHKVMWRGVHASDAHCVDFIERALNHYDSIAVFYQIIILFIRASIFWKSLFLSENAILASLS